MAEIKFEESFIEKSPTTRAVIRKYIIRHNLIPYVCEKCGNDGNWQGQILTLQLDHRNGINNDHRLENLRWLCPNCHSQTETFTGRNKTDKEKVTFTEEQAIQALKNTPNIHQATKYIGCSEGGANWCKLKAIKNKFNIIQEDDINKSSLTETPIGARKKEKRKKKKEEKLCKNCGRPLSSDRCEICQICVHEKQKRCEWPTKEVLKGKIRNKPFLQIAKEYNVSDNAIRKWCKSYGLPYRASDIKKYTYEEWENI